MDQVPKLPRPLRPLLPALESPDVTAGAQRHFTLPRKRTLIKGACQTCRKRKVKCDGAKPRCLACARKGSECEYFDNVPKGHGRQLFSLQNRLNDHEELLHHIQSRKEEDVHDIVRRIRRGDSTRAILQQLRDGDLLLQMSLVPQSWCRYSFPLTRDMPLFLNARDNPYLNSLIYKETMEHPCVRATNENNKTPTYSNRLIQYHLPYHAAKVVDPRLSSGNMIHWTSVSVTGALFSELLQMYFLYEYPIFPFLHMDSFLEDLVTSRRQFCSSLLVNAVLAAGCQGYAKIANRTEFWNPRTLQYQFSAEARRLWDMEVDSPSLTTIQAGLIMSLTCNVNGVDKAGWSYLVRATAMANRLQIFEDLLDTTRRRIRDARALTSWSLFLWQSIFSFHFYRTPLLKDPPQVQLPNPMDNSAWYPKIWILYPSNQNPISVNYGDYFKAAAEFQIIVNSIGSSAFPRIGSQANLSSKQAQDFYSKLRKWYHCLPDSLSITNVVLPWQLSLHMHYFNLINWLMEPFTVPETTYTGGEATGASSFQAVEETVPEALVINAKISLETVFRLYYMRHGFEIFDPLMLQFHSFVGFMALKELSDGREKPPGLVKALQSTLALATLGLRDQGKNSYLGDTIFRILRDMAASKHALPANEIIAMSKEDEDTKAEIAEHINSQFPINVVSIADDPEPHRVESLISQYKEIELNNQSDRSEMGCSPRDC
ncbi:hypothetical protein FOPG_13305 [Fusarium oxysporum f. sp. conglutinans race 2 54008]|uniref:Zn(2)-C6 fungal-type domain-containing protein n=1 Tax=Fusarium oxysporum f. sp. conglutinans race 2 54008 TaxID=1089457 RepID=X0HGJ4_FUSOX|nr:hypothetical protein FOPG_13305 [Fusarium oxysporum f. sp. conglutinans race 2 54008]KAG6995020.1 Nitrogen assimilation transcription factor nit-4 [Fusarium oxysporum f. sp. conglutinans]